MAQLWNQFRFFVKESYEKRFAASMGGCILGFFHSRDWAFVRLPDWIAPYIKDSWVVTKGFLVAFITSLITSYGTHLFQKKIKPHLDGTKRERKKSTKPRRRA